MIRSFKLGATDVAAHYLAERIQRLLIEVWDGIPRPDRQVIEVYWNDEKNHWLLNGPIVATTNAKVDKAALAGTNFHGFLIRIYKRVDEDNPIEDHVKNILAHELGHVHFYASGEHEKSGASVELNEKHANKMMMEWGYEIPNYTPEEHRP